MVSHKPHARTITRRPPVVRSPRYVLRPRGPRKAPHRRAATASPAAAGSPGDSSYVADCACRPSHEEQLGSEQHRRAEGVVAQHGSHAPRIDAVAPARLRASSSDAHERLPNSPSDHLRPGKPLRAADDAFNRTSRSPAALPPGAVARLRITQAATRPVRRSPPRWRRAGTGARSLRRAAGSDRRRRRAGRRCARRARRSCWPRP